MSSNQGIEVGPKKLYVLEAKHNNGIQLLKLRYENERVTFSVAMPSVLPWYRRWWIGLCYALGLRGPLDTLRDTWMTFHMRDEDIGKLMTLSTVAYLKQIQRGKAQNKKLPVEQTHGLSL